MTFGHPASGDRSPVRGIRRLPGRGERSRPAATCVPVGREPDRLDHKGHRHLQPVACQDRRPPHKPPRRHRIQPGTRDASHRRHDDCRATAGMRCAVDTCLCVHSSCSLCAPGRLHHHGLSVSLQAACSAMSTRFAARATGTTLCPPTRRARRPGATHRNTARTAGAGAVRVGVHPRESESGHERLGISAVFRPMERRRSLIVASDTEAVGELAEHRSGTGAREAGDLRKRRVHGQASPAKVCLPT